MIGPMASTKTRKPAPRKKRTVRKKKKAPRFFGQISLSRVLLYLALVIFFFVSIAAAGYVIFFRVVVAAEAERSISRPHVAIILEDMGQRQEIRNTRS